MGDDGTGQSAGFSNMVSLAISVLALFASLATLYWQFLRGPKVRAYQPNVVYLGRSQIGIPVTFTNDGTAADVVVLAPSISRPARALGRRSSWPGYHPLSGARPIIPTRPMKIRSGWMRNPIMTAFPTFPSRLGIQPPRSSGLNPDPTTRLLSSLFLTAPAHASGPLARSPFLLRRSSYGRRLRIAVLQCSLCQAHQTSTP